jgi:hypothetical protein
MRKKLNLSMIALALAATSFTACNSGSQNTENADATIDTANTQEIQVVPVADSKAFPGANLEISSITSEKVGTDSARITVKYDVKNFTLTEHTDDMNAEHMANSKEGQHIHFILDNSPYVALYKPENTVTVKLGTEHYLLSFLSRSYHESIKEDGAAILKHFKIDENGVLSDLALPTEPSLFYSRPKGDYTGADTERLLLDFYVWNTDLKDGNKVKATINGADFMLDNWGPYEILNAPKGELTVNLSLVDQDGNALSGDNVSISRTVTLK